MFILAITEPDNELMWIAYDHITAIKPYGSHSIVFVGGASFIVQELPEEIINQCQARREGKDFQRYSEEERNEVLETRKRWLTKRS